VGGFLEPPSLEVSDHHLVPPSRSKRGDGGCPNNQLAKIHNDNVGIPQLAEKEVARVGELSCLSTPQGSFVFSLA